MKTKGPWIAFGRLAVAVTLITSASLGIKVAVDYHTRISEPRIVADRAVNLTDGEGIVVATGETVTLDVLADVIFAVDAGGAPLLRTEAGICDVGIGHLGNKWHPSRNAVLQQQVALKIGHIYLLKCNDSDKEALVRVDAYDTQRKIARLSIRFRH